MSKIISNYAAARNINRSEVMIRALASLDAAMRLESIGRHDRRYDKGELRSKPDHDRPILRYQHDPLLRRLRSDYASHASAVNKRLSA